MQVKQWDIFNFALPPPFVNQEMASKRSYADISSQGDSDDSVECQLPESEKPNHAPKPKKQRPQKSNKYSRSMTQYDSSQQSFLPLYESDDSAIEDHSGGVISAEAATYLRGVRYALVCARRDSDTMLTISTQIRSPLPPRRLYRSRYKQSILAHHWQTLFRSRASFHRTCPHRASPV